jgi:hypothetical protein
MNGVKVTITKGDFPTPFGLEYTAKGAYVQKKHIVVVGTLHPDTTIRIKYPKSHIKLEFI